MQLAHRCSARLTLLSHCSGRDPNPNRPSNATLTFHKESVCVCVSALMDFWGMRANWSHSWQHMKPLDVSQLLQLAFVPWARNSRSSHFSALFHSALRHLRMLSLRAKSVLGHHFNVVSFALNPTFKKILAMVHWCLTYPIISRFTVLEEAEQY